MTQKFNSTIDGKALFKKSLIFLITYIICFAGLMQMAISEIWIGYFIMIILLLVASFALQFQFINAFIPAITFDEKPFSFNGTFSDYMKINLKGLLLTVITLGIYSSWYAKDINCFLADHTSYPEKNLTFNGRGGKLLIYTLFSFLLPIIILVAILTPMYIAGLQGNYSMLILAGIIYIGGVFIIASVYSFYEYKWMINYTFGSDDVILNATAMKAILFVFIQMFLGMITFGIYMFAAEVKIFAYFADHTVFRDRVEGKDKIMHFTGITGEGFSLILGQTLLTIITLGLYMPVAYARINNWFISNLEVGEDQSE